MMVHSIHQRICKIVYTMGMPEKIYNDGTLNTSKDMHIVDTMCCRRKSTMGTPHTSKDMQIVDTMGCGDSYHAGFVCPYAIGKDIMQAMKTGTKFATKTLGTYGGY